MNSGQEAFLIPGAGLSSTLPDSLDGFLMGSDKEPLSTGEQEKIRAWLAKILSEPNTLASMVRRALHQGITQEWQEDSANHHFKIGSYHPSKIENCVRQQAYSYIDPKPPTPEQLLIFREGQAIHELIAEALHRSNVLSVEGREIVVELKFNDDIMLHGRIDDLLLISLPEKDGKDSRLLVPLEIKSTASLPDRPKRTHYYQLSSYLLARDYPVGVLLYWGKRSGQTCAFTITKDQAMFEILRSRVYEIDTALRSKALPRKEAALDRDYRQCEYCAYSEECNPFLIPDIPRNSNLALFDIDTTLLDTSNRRKVALQQLGLPTTLRVSDLEDEEVEKKFWEIFNQEKLIQLDDLIQQGKENVYNQVSLGRMIVGISSARRAENDQPTIARLANLGVALNHIITREAGNFERDIKFKTKWAARLLTNYSIAEYFDRDAAASSMVMKVIRERLAKPHGVQNS